MRHFWKHRRAAQAASPCRYARCVGIAVALLAMIAPSYASAKPSDNVALEVAVPPNCPSEQALLDSLDSLLGSDFETDTRLQAEVHITQSGLGDWGLELRYRTSSGSSDSRQLRGETCAAVSEAAALVLALALNPRALSKPEPKPQPDPEQTPLAQADEPAVEPSSSGVRLAPSVGVLGVFDTALMPESSGGVGAHLGLRIGLFELRVRGQLLLPRDHVQGGVTTTFGAWSVDLGVCAHLPLGPALVGPCARAEVGSLRGQLQGDVVVDSPGTGRVQALGLGAEARWPVAPPLWLSLNADFSWITRRPVFDATRDGPAQTDMGVQVSVGQSARFGLRVCLGPLLAW